MIGFSQWWNAYQKTGVKQVTWVCGPEPILIDEVAQLSKQALQPDPWDFASLDVLDINERVLWTELEQYPLTEGGNRLVAIRNAQALKKPERIISWLETRKKNPKTFLLFLSADAEVPRLPGEGREKGEPLPHIAAFSGKGYVVECRPFTQATAKHAVAWVRKKAKITERVAGYLLDRADGNLRLVRDVCVKLSSFDQEVNISTINALLSETPRESFVEALVALDKKTALLALRDVPESDYSRIVGLLDSELEFAGRLHDMQKQHMEHADIMKAAGNRAFRVKDILPLAKHYDPKRRNEARRVLATVDEALRNGQYVGVLETVAALW